MEENNEKALQQNEDLKRSVAKDSDGTYDNVVIYLTKDDGTVVVKGGMKYMDVIAMNKLHGALPHEVVGMFFQALEDDLKKKNNASNTIDTTEGPSTEGTEEEK